MRSWYRWRLPPQCVFARPAGLRYHAPMVPTLTLLAALAAADPSPLAAEAERSEAITEAELKAHVYRLAAPEFQGRKGPGADRAAKHLADTFRRLGLAPAFGDSYLQPIPWLLGASDPNAPKAVGYNVGAMLPGSDPALRDEWIILS